MALGFRFAQTCVFAFHTSDLLIMPTLFEVQTFNKLTLDSLRTHGFIAGLDRAPVFFLYYFVRFKLCSHMGCIVLYVFSQDSDGFAAPLHHLKHSTDKVSNTFQFADALRIWVFFAALLNFGLAPICGFPQDVGGFCCTVDTFD